MADRLSQLQDAVNQVSCGNKKLHQFMLLITLINVKYLSCFSHVSLDSMLNRSSDAFNKKKYLCFGWKNYSIYENTDNDKF